MLKPIQALDWYYNQSDSDLGFSAQSFDGMPQSDRDFHPSQQTMDAAARQKIVRHALQELAPVCHRGSVQPWPPCHSIKAQVWAFSWYISPELAAQGRQGVVVGGRHSKENSSNSSQGIYNCA